MKPNWESHAKLIEVITGISEGQIGQDLHTDTAQGNFDTSLYLGM